MLLLLGVGILVALIGVGTAWLVTMFRFPGQRVSVAVLCNVASAQATQYAHAVADLYLRDQLKPSEIKATHTLTDAEAAAFTGLWKDDVTGLSNTIVGEQGRLTFGGSIALFPQSPMRVLMPSGDALQLYEHGLRHTDAYGTVSGSWTRLRAGSP